MRRFAMLLLVAPALLAGQTPGVVTLGLAAGPAYGDGGWYTDRSLHSYTAVMDFGAGWIGKWERVVGVTYAHYRGSNVLSYSAPVCAATEGMWVGWVDVVPCKPGSFPEFNAGSIDLGLRREIHDFSLLVKLQPTLAQAEHPARLGAGTGAGLTVGRKLFGPLGVEASTSAMYLPSLSGSRLGLRQATIGLVLVDRSPDRGHHQP